jgi:thymidylate synthase (FAD)
MKINVLDHGYVELVKPWGDGKDAPGDYESGIIEAARQSTQGSFRGWDQDEKLLKYLYEHRHATPFEFAGCVLEVQAPIFVFREWQRHRTQSFNEMSARYAPLPDLCYVPKKEDLIARSKAAAESTNRQAGSTGKVIAEDDAAAWLDMVDSTYGTQERIYQFALRAGVPRELARITMPVGHYSRMRASASLRNWLAFLTLRMDPAAQWEIREFAYAVGSIMRATFPQTMKLYDAE